MSAPQQYTSNDQIEEVEKPQQQQAQDQGDDATSGPVVIPMNRHTEPLSLEAKEQKTWYVKAGEKMSAVVEGFARSADRGHRSVSESFGNEATSSGLPPTGGAKNIFIHPHEKAHIPEALKTTPVVADTPVTDDNSAGPQGGPQSAGGI